MREILFKAKRIDNGEWVEGSLIDSGNHEQVFIYPHFDGASTMSCRSLVYHRMIAVDPDTICQYAGLNDKDGNKIWENDIVKRYTANGDEWRISKIVWADHSLNMGWCIEDVKSLTEYSNRLFKVGFDVNDTEKCEVIGNIFDNEDLLKGE